MSSSQVNETKRKRSLAEIVYSRRDLNRRTILITGLISYTKNAVFKHNLSQSLRRPELFVLTQRVGVAATGMPLVHSSISSVFGREIK